MTDEMGRVRARPRLAGLHSLKRDPAAPESRRTALENMAVLDWQRAAIG